MFERAAALWRRLTGSAQAKPAGGPKSDSDRRVFVRYPSETLTRCALLGNGNEPLFSARLRNVSRGGLNLATERLL